MSHGARAGSTFAPPAARRGGRRRDLQPRDRGAPGHVRDAAAAGRTRSSGGSRRGGRSSSRPDGDGTILGFARVSAYSTRRAYAGVGEHAVYVAPAARGRGVGVKLLDALARRVRGRGLLQAHEPGVHDQPGEPEAAPGGRVHRGGHPAPPRAARQRVEGHGARRTAARRGRALKPRAVIGSAARWLETVRRAAPPGLRASPSGGRPLDRAGARRCRRRWRRSTSSSGDQVVFTTTFVLAPFALAVTRPRARPTAALAALAVALAIASGYWNHYEGSTDHLLRIAIVAAGGILATLAAIGAREGRRAAPADGDPRLGRPPVRRADARRTRSRAWPRRSCRPPRTAAGST